MNLQSVVSRVGKSFIFRKFSGNVKSTADTAVCALRAVELAMDGDVLVTGRPRSGKTASFVVPLVQQWVGPVVLFTIGGSYPALRDVRGRAGRTLDVDLSECPLALGAGLLQLGEYESGESAGEPDQIATIIVSLLPSDADALFNADGKLRRLVESLFSSLGQSVMNLPEGRALASVPLVIVDDFWASSPLVLGELLSSLDAHEEVRARLVVVGNSLEGMEIRSGYDLLSRLLLRCTAHVYFGSVEPLAALNPFATTITDGIPLESLASLEDFEAYAASRGSCTRGRFAPYFEADSAS